MRQLLIFCHIFCHDHHIKWAELLPRIEDWINKTFASGTRYTSLGLIYEDKRPNAFRKIMPKVQVLEQEEEVEANLEAAYGKTKQNAKEVKEEGRKETTSEHIK